MILEACFQMLLKVDKCSDSEFRITKFPYEYLVLLTYYVIGRK